MTLSELSIRRRVFAWILMAGLIVFGGIALTRMGVSELPDVDFPVVTIQLELIGAAPEIMETQLVDPVEDGVMSIEGVRNVTSTAYEGVAEIAVEFQLGRNIDAALQDVQAKVSQAQRLLPREMEAPIITKINPEDEPIIWLGLYSDKHSPRELMVYVRDRLKNQFATVPGVGDIILGGYVEPNMRIWVSEDALRRYYLSVNDIITTIQNEHSEPPSGFLEAGKKESNIRVLGEASTPEEFGNFIINQRGALPNYRPVKLSQVATIEKGLADIRRISRTEQRLAVGIGIRKQRGSNAVAVGDAVKKRMKEVEKTLPPGMHLGINFDSTKFIRDSVNELNVTLLLSAILTSIVCWIFLGSWSSTFNVVLAIPTSIIGSFIVLYFADFTLNTFTLLALSLAIGIVVDDAIMVLENIVRHRELGESQEEGAIKGSNEIAFAALAATLAIVAIFLPVAFMRGIIGKFFFQFGVTLTVAVTLSLLEALTLTPMRCASFLQIGERSTRFGRFVDRSFDTGRKTYTRFLASALRNRWKVVITSLVIFAISMVSVRFINKEFVPAQDQSLFLVKLQTPVGSSLEYTDAKFKEAEKYLSTRPELDRYFVVVGGFTGGEINSGMLFVTLKDPDQRELSQQQLMDLVRTEFNKIPDLQATIQDLSTAGFTASRGFPVEFAVTGPDWNELAKYADQIKEQLKKTGLITDLDTDYLAGKPEIRLYPLRDQAAAHGVTVTAIGQVISAMIGGQVVGKYNEGGHRYDVRLKLLPEEKSRPEEVNILGVRNNRGELIQLSDVVRMETQPSLQMISRRDRQRAISIWANVAPGKSQADALAAVDRISKQILPLGYQTVLTGTSETFKESFQSLVFVLILGVIVSYMVLASQFDSFIDPFTVLMALPFSASGAFVSLLLTRQSLNIYSLIGLILLMGIVKKNSILLVDFTNQIRWSKKKHTRAALIEACPLRLRPILMTSIATIAGAIPPALSIGPGAETRVPMALAVIGGIIVSTALTLFVVPCVYSLLAGLRRTKKHALHARPLTLGPSERKASKEAA